MANTVPHIYNDNVDENEINGDDDDVDDARLDGHWATMTISMMQIIFDGNF